MEQRFGCRILAFDGGEAEKMEIRRIIDLRLSGTTEKGSEK